MKFWKLMFWIAVIGFVLLLTGCFKSYTSPIPSGSPATGSQALIQIIYKTNWLVTLGILLSAMGVMTLINGSTKGMAIIGGGLTVIALAGLVATFFAVLADYSGWIILGLGCLIAVGFFAFVVTAADVNGDGRINWQDLKDLLRKI